MLFLENHFAEYFCRMCVKSQNIDKCHWSEAEYQKKVQEIITSKMMVNLFGPICFLFILVNLGVNSYQCCY